MGSSKMTCGKCGRSIAPWVAETGLTLHHDGNDFCRFCYVELRRQNKISARGEDRRTVLQTRQNSDDEVSGCLGGTHPDLAYVAPAQPGAPRSGKDGPFHAHV